MKVLPLKADAFVLKMMDFAFKMKVLPLKTDDFCRDIDTPIKHSIVIGG